MSVMMLLAGWQFTRVICNQLLLRVLCWPSMIVSTHSTDFLTLTRLTHIPLDSLPCTHSTHSFGSLTRLANWIHFLVGTCSVMVLLAGCYCTRIVCRQLTQLTHSSHFLDSLTRLGYSTHSTHSVDSLGSSARVECTYRC